MRDWFKALRSGDNAKVGVPGVPGVPGENNRLKTDLYTTEVPEHQVLSDVCRCTGLSLDEKHSTPGTPEAYAGVPTFVDEKYCSINVLGCLEHQEHQEHQEHPKKHECGAVVGDKQLPKIITADQLSPGERTLFCLEHELTEYGGRCPNKENLEGCVLWNAIRQRLLVTRPEIPSW